MDIDNFSQCLQYIQTLQPKFSTDKLLPVVTGLLGTFLGFSLNYWSSNRKDAKTVKGKKVCCEADVEQIQRSVMLVIREVCNLCSIIEQGERLWRHKVPSSVSSLYLNKHFSEIAHEYSKVKRESVQSIIDRLDILNKRLPDTSPNEKVSAHSYSITLTNLANIASVIWQHCENFKNGEASEPDEDEIFSRLDLSDIQINSRNIIKENIDSGNAMLDLATKA